MSLETKIIIPAAGFGTRVGSPEAKEMLILKDQKPLIDFSLEIADQNHAVAHVVTRKEKKSLINYLADKQSVQVQIIEPSREWPDTILKSKSFWGKYNILILPDTRFAPIHIVSELIQNLQEVDITVGYFTPDNFETWGAFDINSPFYRLIEKPKNISTINLKAWGVIGFRKEIGEELFRLILESTLDHQIKMTSFSFKAIPLDSFEDLTR